LDVLDDDDSWSEFLGDLGNQGDKKIPLIPHTRVWVRLAATVTASAAHALTGWAGGKKGRASPANAGSVLGDDLGPSGV
jgi:hypothetical protein